MRKFINNEGSVILGLIVAVVATALVAGGLVYSWQKKQGDNKIQEVQKQVQEKESKVSDLEQKINELQADIKTKMNYSFKLETFTNNIADQKVLDSKIIKVYEDGSTEIIVSSTKEKINNILCAVTQYNQDSFLYFKTCTPDSDDGKGQLVVYDVGRGELKYLENINKVYIGWGSLVFSPDKKFAAYVPDTYAQQNMTGQEGLDQNLYLFNLLNDSSDDVVTLSGRESFNRGCGAMSSVYEISWLSDNIIQYNVFNKAKGNCVLNNEASAVRQFKLE